MSIGQIGFSSMTLWTIVAFALIVIGALVLSGILMGAFTPYGSSGNFGRYVMRPEMIEVDVRPRHRHGPQPAEPVTPAGPMTERIRRRKR